MRQKSDTTVMEEVVEWLAVLAPDDAPEATRSEFVDWLARSPVHVEEFLRASALRQALAQELKSSPEWLNNVLYEAVVEKGNVVEMADFEPISSSRDGKDRTANRRMRWAAAAALFVATLATVGILNLTSIGDGGGRYATEIGEQRWVVLEDGSRVLLNTDSEIRVRMTEDLRHVALLRGEAVFDVEKDPARKFQVLANTVLVEAIGTRFNVDRREERVVVTVLEGKVAIMREGSDRSAARVLVPDDESPGSDPQIAMASPAPVRLDAGLQIAVQADGSILPPKHADTKRVTAWTERRMVFDADRLDAVVAEFNRYNRDRLEIIDATLKGRRITGVFNIDDPDAFLTLLTDLIDVEVEQRPDGLRRIHRAESSLQ